MCMWCARSVPLLAGKRYMRKCAREQQQQQHMVHLKHDSSQSCARIPHPPLAPSYYAQETRRRSPLL